jgi:putative protease
MNRGYTTAYFYGKNDKTQSINDEQNNSQTEFVAWVNEYSNDIATVEMRNRFRCGDVLEVLSPTNSFLQCFTVTHVENAFGQQVDDAKLVQHIYKISCPIQLRHGDILRKL